MEIFIENTKISFVYREKSGILYVGSINCFYDAGGRSHCKYIFKGEL